MKKITFILFFLISGFDIQSQVNLDSLWAVWNDETAPDTCRANALSRISMDGYLYSQPDSAFYFAQVLYDFANKYAENGSILTPWEAIIVSGKKE